MIQILVYLFREIVSFEFSWEELLTFSSTQFQYPSLSVIINNQLYLTLKPEAHNLHMESCIENCKLFAAHARTVYFVNFN